MKTFDDLMKRNLVKQVTSQKVEEMINNEKITFYCGFDPTADSLHIGSLLPLITMKRLMKAGHNPIVILGNATASIGDPSGKSAERNMLSQEVIDKNLLSVQSQILNVLGSEVLVLKNLDWFKDISFIDFLRNVGKNFSVNNMLTKDSVKSRLQNEGQGISFTEFSYMLLQAEDFRHLFVNHNCILEVAGQDNWPHILSGIELIRKTTTKEAFGMTFPLVTKSDGGKFGKTEKGNVWLDSNKTSPFEFFQFFLNIKDDDIEGLLKFFSLKSLDDIENILQESRKDLSKRIAQKELAEELTLLIHGDQGLKEAKEKTQARFTDNSIIGDPDLWIKALDLQHLSLIELLVQLGLSPSKTMARKDVQSGAIKINGEKTLDLNKKIDEKCFTNQRCMVSRGKTNHKIIQLKD